MRAHRLAKQCSLEEQHDGNGELELITCEYILEDE